MPEETSSPGEELPPEEMVPPDPSPPKDEALLAADPSEPAVEPVTADGDPAIEMSDEMRGAFEEVVVDVKAKQAAVEQPPPPPPRPVPWMIGAAASWLLFLGVLLFPPGFARTPPDQSFVAPRDLRAASLRFGLWLARHRADAFTRGAARPPAYAGEAGVDDLAITIENNGERRYTLVARDSGIVLKLSSEMAVDSFLGESLTTLAASQAYQQAGIPGRTTAR